MSDNYTPGEKVFDDTYIPIECAECWYTELRSRVPAVNPCASCACGPEGCRHE